MLSIHLSEVEKVHEAAKQICRSLFVLKEEKEKKRVSEMWSKEALKINPSFWWIVNFPLHIVAIQMKSGPVENL